MPLTQNKPKESTSARKRAPNFLFLKVVIVATLFGFAAGLVGELLMQTYYPFFFNIPTSETVIKRAKKQEPLIDSKLGELIYTLSPTLVSIYIKEPAHEVFLDQFLLPQDYQGQGFILTSDGWIMTSQEVASASPEAMAVIYKNKIFAITSLVADPASSAVFIKIDSENLPVVKLGETQSLVLRESLLALNPSGAARVTQVENLIYYPDKSPQDIIRSSERFQRFGLLKDFLPLSYRGGPLFNLEGEVVGLIKNLSPQEGVAVLSLHHLRKAIIDVLKQQSIERVYLGAHYLDLAEVTSREDKSPGVFHQGALIYGAENLGIEAVQEDSPARGLLKAQDIILEVDTQAVNKNHNLTDLIQEYRSGDKVELTVLREKRKIKLKIELGKMKPSHN